MTICIFMFLQASALYRKLFAEHEWDYLEDRFTNTTPGRYTPTISFYRLVTCKWTVHLVNEQIHITMGILLAVHRNPSLIQTHAVTVVMDGVLLRLSHVLEQIIASLYAKSLQHGGRNEALLGTQI